MGKGALVGGCGISGHLPVSVIEEWVREDLPYVDLTTSALGIASVRAKASVITREEVIACGLAEAAAVYEYLGGIVEGIAEEGRQVRAGEVLLEVTGSAASLHAAWRVAQVLVAIGSAVATHTRELVASAREVSPNVIVAVARKAPPGLRHLYYRCVLCGGASLHRVGISDSVLVFPNHTRLVGGLKEALSALKERRWLIGERRVVVEVSSLQEALLAAESGVVDEVQVDHLSPDELRSLIEEVKAVNPSIKVAVGGGIGLENIKEYASTGVDVIVTSAPYWVRPADVTTRIEKA